MTNAPFSVSSRSGSDEQYTEKDQLLTELATLQKEKDPPPANATAAARAERTVALQLRDDACATFGQKRSADKSEKEPEVRRRATASIADNMLLYFEEKDEREEEAARRRLSVEQEKLRLQERELEAKIKQQNAEAVRLDSEIKNKEQERKMEMEKLDVEKMRLRAQERELELKHEREQREATRREQKEDEDRKERQELMKLMFSKLQDK